MPQPLRVLLLEDRPADARLMVSELKLAGYAPSWEWADTEEEFLAWLETGPDLILAGYAQPQFGAPQALAHLRRRGLDIPFIIVSGSSGEEIAVAAIREGATSYLIKDRLGQAVRHALEQRRLWNTERQAEETLRERTQFILLTAEVGLALNRKGTLREMLRHCGQALLDNLDTAVARIWTFQESDSVLELQAAVGLNTRLDDAYARVPLENFGIGRIAQERIPHLTNDVASDLHLGDREWAQREGLVAFAGFPLVVEDRLVGTLATYARHPLNFAKQDALSAAANQIAAGIDRKRTEQCLQFTQFTIDHIATAVFWSDHDGRFFNVNQAACTLTGYSREELLALHVHDLDSNVTSQSWPRVWQELKQRRSVTGETRLRRKNGADIPISIASNLLQGKCREYSCMFVQDIIERKAAEFAQRQSELRFRAVFNQTFEFVGLLAADGSVLELNQPALDFRQLRLADVAGRPLWETPWLDVSQQTREQLQQVVLGAAASGFVRQEITAREESGSLRTFDLSAKRVLNEAGQVELLIVEARDVTEQKRLEEQFRQAQKMEAIGKLAGGVAHDFNNLLTIILGYNGMVQESLHPGDPLLELVEQIHKAGQRAAGLTRQLLAFSRKQVLVPVVLDLKVLVEEMQGMLSRLIGEDVNFAFRPAAGLWPVRVDAGQMEQVIMNLVVNARDAMPQGGNLTIEAANIQLEESYAASHADTKAGDHVLLAISDTGCGMDPTTLSQIFEPFFTTKGPEKGTGLGLATVYGIVKQSGGHIAVDSEPGKGSTFNVYLPRAPEGIVAARPTAAPKSRVGGTETVLLVEDEEAVRALARAILQHHGYRILEACNGIEALALCEQCQDPIHLLATDVVMPHMSGRELAQRLVSLRKDIKVLYLSGYMDDTIVHHGLLDAGVPFLRKPYTPEGLARKVREVLGK